MQFVILGVLLIQPSSLYDLHKAFREGISLFYTASYGSIQRALTVLERNGLISHERAAGDPRGKKIHTITDAGRVAWHEWMRAPVEGGDAETTILSKVFFLGLLPAHERADAIATMRQRIDHDAAQLDQASVQIDSVDVPEQYRDVLAYQRATLTYGIRAHALAAQWLDDLGKSAQE